MSQLTLNRIAGVLAEQYGSLVEMQDYAGKSDEERRKALLSRAVAALCVKALGNTDPKTAAASVTDGYQDGGLDAVHFDERTDTLILVQSKWNENGNRPLDDESANKFVLGVRNLLADRFDAFNASIQKKRAQIRSILYSDRSIRLRLVTAHTATQATAPHVLARIQDLVAELNDPVPVASHTDYNQAGIYGLITSESKDPKIKLQIVLNEFGKIDRPCVAYYGRVHIGNVAEWWTAHGNRLFAENLRLFYDNSTVNEALKKTVVTDAQNFWYFNNGITVICDKIVRQLAGAPGGKLGLFTCEGVSIVNGAQTVGTIGSNYAPQAISTPSEEDPDAESAWVQVRLISLEHAPPDFARRITRAANLQNAVGNREFAAMDPRQHRLATEFALDRRKYAYKQGEQDPKGEEGCSIVEATQALACIKSVELAVRAKREIGGLWADTDSAPYTDLFNDQLTSARVWSAVRVMRAVDDRLQILRRSDAPRADYIGVHMNRIILHLAFTDPAVKEAYWSMAPDSEMIAAAVEATNQIFPKVAAYIEERHTTEYLANFSKNSRKCEALVSWYHAPALKFDDLGAGDGQGNLF